jgi:hypothetical protein
VLSVTLVVELSVVDDSVAVVSVPVVDVVTV